MDERPIGCALVSDFNLQNFAGLIGNDGSFPRIEPIAAPYGQTIPTLLSRDAACWRSSPDLAVVWTRPQSVIPAFGDLLMYEKVPLETILGQVDDYSALLAEAAGRVKFMFVPAWVTPPRQVFSVLDMKTGFGLTNTVARMNLRLAEHLEATSNAYLLNTRGWVERAGARAFNPKLWYLAKVEFGNEVFREAARATKAALRGLLGRARKLIIVDLDDTVWGGTVGDLGWEGLVLGGRHHIGEAYVDFQRALKAMKNRGIVLGIVSKNEEQVALEAIGRHPEMVLGLDDFAGWRINWRDKAQNVLDLLTELNLGPQSAVFIDDSPAERARVKQGLPEVLVPDWPDDPTLYPSALLGLSCFEISSLSREDIDRGAMYLSESRRRALKKSVGSVGDWLRRLSIRVCIEELKTENLQRTAQLLNKTNQMNLSTRRMSEAELLDWTTQPNHRLWTLRVSDKFGDSGLTGIVSMDIQPDGARIVDFILSCRVMGRQIEEAMLAVAVEHAARMGLEQVTIEYKPTPKNQPCLDFFKTLVPRIEQEGRRFYLSTADPFPYPGHLEIEHRRN